MQTKHLILACIYHATMRPFVSHYLGFLNFQTYLRSCGWYYMNGIQATDKHYNAFAIDCVHVGACMQCGQLNVLP